MNTSPRLADVRIQTTHDEAGSHEDAEFQYTYTPRRHRPPALR